MNPTTTDQSHARQALPLRVEWAADPGAVAAAISDERLIGLYTFWLGLDTFPLLPAARAVVPVDLLRVWPNVAIVAPESGRMRYRMAGSEVVARLGADVAGRFVDEVAGGIRLALLEALYELCRDARAAVYARSHLAQLPGAAPGEDVVVHRLMLPLSGDDRAVDAILCGETYVRPGAGAGRVSALALRASTEARDEAECHAWVDSAQAAAMHADGSDAVKATPHRAA